MRIPNNIKIGDTITWSDDPLASVVTAIIVNISDDYITAENDYAVYHLNFNKEFEFIGKD